MKIFFLCLSLHECFFTSVRVSRFVLHACMSFAWIPSNVVLKSATGATPVPTPSTKDGPRAEALISPYFLKRWLKRIQVTSLPCYTIIIPRYTRALLFFFLPFRCVRKKRFSFVSYISWTQRLIFSSLMLFIFAVFRFSSLNKRFCLYKAYLISIRCFYLYISMFFIFYSLIYIRYFVYLFLKKTCPFCEVIFCLPNNKCLEWDFNRCNWKQNRAGPNQSSSWPYP